MRVTPTVALANEKRTAPQRMRTAQDRHSHVPVHVVWEITLACNLKCGHCGSRAGKSVSNPGDVSEALDAARADKKSTVLMRLRSGDASRYVAVPVTNG